MTAVWSNLSVADTFGDVLQGSAGRRRSRRNDRELTFSAGNRKRVLESHAMRKDGAILILNRSCDESNVISAETATDAVAAPPMECSYSRM